MTTARELLRDLRDMGAEDLAIDRLSELREAILAAEKASERFHWGNVPKHLDVIDVPLVSSDSVLYRLGELVEIAYQTPKGDEPDTIWVHAFRRPLPTLAATVDGGLVIAGGGYRVTRRGIVG